MTKQQLLTLILDHLKRSKEGRYAWSERVMGDKTFLWKLEHYARAPYPRTVTKIKRSIQRKEASMKASKAKARRAGVGRRVVIRG